MSKLVTIPDYMSPFQVTVNGIPYKYEPGSAVEVPDEVAAVIENQIALERHPAENIDPYIKAPAAKVGQTIVVKSVDANGNPTAWQAADLPNGSSIMYVEAQGDGAIANFTGEQIENHVRNGGVVYFSSQAFGYSENVPLSGYLNNRAYFTYINVEEGMLEQALIYRDGSVEFFRISL